MGIRVIAMWLHGTTVHRKRGTRWSVPVWNLLLIAIMVLLTDISIRSNESADQQSSPQMERVARSKRIVRVGYYPFDGFHMLDKNGNRDGYGYDYLQKLCDYTNWEYEYSDPRYEWPEMLDMLREGKIDLLAGVAKTRERQTEFAFSEKPICQVSSVLTVKAGNTRYRNDDYGTWNGIKVGILKNSIQTDSMSFFSKEKGFSYKPVFFDKIGDLVAALQDGKEIDAVVTNSLRAIPENEWICAQFDTSFMYIVVRKNDHTLLNELNAAMEHLEMFYPDFQKQLRKIYYKHGKGGIIPFSQQELLFIEEAKKSGRVFSLIMNPDRKPFSWFENGEYHGIFKEYAEEISRRTGLKFRYVPARTRAEYCEKRFSPGVDIVFDMLLDFGHAENNQMKLSQPYYSASVSKLRDKDAGNIIKTITMLKNGDLEEKVRSTLPPNVNIRFCNSVSDMINEVRSTVSDAAYLFTRSAEYAVYEDESNHLVSEYIPSLETNIALGVRKDLDPLLLSILNRGVLSLDEMFTNQVQAKYVPKFKEVFSLHLFIHRYPFHAIGIPFVILLLICLFLVSLLFVWNRRREELQRSVTKWDATAKIAKLLPFQMHLASRRICDDAVLFNTFWPAVDGKAVEPRDWVCSEDLPRWEKALDELATMQSDQFWVTYRVIQDGITRHFVCYAVRDVNDPEMIVGIIQDISETKEVESQRDAVQRLWQKVVDNAPVMMFIKSETDDFRYIQCNRIFAEFLGRSPEEVVGHTDAELFNRPADAESFRKRDQEVMASSQPYKFQESVLNAEGQLRHIQTVKMSLSDVNGQALLIGMSADITELQNSRDEVRKHEEIFRLTIESIGDGVLTTDENGFIQTLNPVAEQLIGLKTDQAKGRQHEEVFRIVSALDGKQVASPLKKALEEGKIVELGNHTDLLSFDGSRYHIADCAGPIRNQDNEIIGAVLIFRDVTETYRQREELRASVALWNVISEVAKLVPFRMHIPTRQVYGDVEKINQYWPVIDGKAVPPKDWMSPEDMVQGDIEFEKFITGESDTFFIIFRIVRDGKTHYYRRYAVRDALDPDMMVGIIQDITLDEEIQREHNASQALWEQVVHAMPILMFVKSADDDFRYIQCNQNFANFIGRDMDEIIGHTDLEFFPGEREKEHFRNWDSKIMEEGKVQEFYEEAQGANKYYHFKTVKIPFTDAKGQRLLIGLAVDISAYKKKEEERNATQKLLNNVFATLPIILYIKSADDHFRYIQCNENFCKLFGKTENEILDRTDEDIFPNPQEVASFRESDRKVMESDEPMEIIETLSGADNRIYHFRTVKMAATDASGKRILVGMAVNITEMVEQREKIQDSRIQLAVGCQLTRSFTFELDANQNILSTNGLYTELFPHINGKPLQPDEWIIPEDVQAPKLLLEKFFNNECPEITINFRSDWFGKRRFYKSILKKVNEKYFGVTTDVTELLEASENVKANALMWKQVMDELPVRFFVKDIDNECRYVMCNKANAEFLGLLEKEIIGKTTEEICEPTPAIMEYLESERQILVDHKVSRVRISLPDPNGVVREMEKIEIPIIGTGNRSLLVSIAFDITEREQSLRLAEISAHILAGVVAEPDFSKVLNLIGETVTKVLNCQRVIFAKCDEHGKLHFMQDAGVTPNYHINKQVITIHEYYWNLYLDQLNRNEFVLLERIGDADPLQPLFEDFPQLRNMALIGVPIIIGGKLYGSMIVTFNEPHVFTDNDMRTLRAIGNCIIMAENRSQQNEALLAVQQEQAYQLAERTALNECLAIFMGSDYMEIPFEEILETIRKHLGASCCYVLRTDSDTKMMSCLAEANSDDNDKFLIDRPPFSFSTDSLWYTELQEKTLVGWPDLNTDEARARLDETWTRIVQEQQIHSLWVASIETNENIWGTLGIVYDGQSSKPFNKKDESFVRSVARVVSLILTRVQYRNDLVSALETQVNTTECLQHMVGEEEASVAMRHLLDIIRKHTGADSAFMTELKEDSMTARTWGMLTMDGNYRHHDKDEVPFGPNEEWYLLFKQDKSLFIPDTSKVAIDKVLGSWVFLLHLDAPVQSYYEIPVHCNGKLWGSFGIMYTSAVTVLNQNRSDFMMNAKKFFEILLTRWENTRKLNEALQLAQAAEKAKSFFLASMSHEIRTPLNAVIGFTEMLKDVNILNDTRIEYIENISIASNALLQLINDILDLSKLEAGQMLLLPERVDFPKYCRSICRTFQYSANQKNLDLIVDVPETMPPLMLDQMRMRQIFFNLIGNSVKFTPTGGKVTVSASFSQLTDSNGSLLLKFADTGIGMPEDDQKKIFEPFVQLSKMRGTNASNNGTGLGLPIVRRLVDRMGGSLTVESAIGKGTTFFILLPKVDMADNCSTVESDPPFLMDESPDDMLHSSSGKLHVLVVDDIPINIKIFTVLLKRLDVSFDTAESGPEALKKLQEQSFDWVMTDMFIKDMSGVELAQIIRKNPAYQNVRIAVVTAESDPLLFDKNLFDVCLSKPIDRQQLWQCLFKGEK